MEGSLLSPALEALEHVRSEDGKILTKPFLDVCKTVLPILDKFGGAFSFVKSDIGGNIEVGLKLVPDRKSFMEAIGTGDLSSDIEKFCDSFSLVLAENHKVLASVNMDNRKI
ncbi:hypothetical protein KIW84_032005 [Lathyrus oleraceus]|uniref:Glycolipid transfer protein domain-containing protein n=1 Tax=Pisum sativum TaxID=3888 RepID=A0A9D4XS75_PEA|nr:hypothetical protein KIW84_032005 [Pisum sativum]